MPLCHKESELLKIVYLDKLSQNKVFFIFSNFLIKAAHRKNIFYQYVHEMFITVRSDKYNHKFSRLFVEGLQI